MGVLRTLRHGAVYVVLSGHENDQCSAPTTSIGCRRSLVPQDCVPRHLALVVLKAGLLIEVKRYFSNLVLAYHRPTDDDCDATMQHLSVDVSNYFV